MRIRKIILPFLLFTLLSNTAFATVSYEGKELKETSYSARKLGVKSKEQILGFTRFSKRVLGNEIGSIGKIDDMIDAARKGTIKLDDAIIATPNKLNDLKRVVKNPLENTKYTSKVEGQMANQVDWHHSFPKSVDGLAGVSTYLRVYRRESIQDNGLDDIETLYRDYTGL